ncbi:MAG: hypothetical protein ABR505_10150 [Actinomycetota bacterium]
MGTAVIEELRQMGLIDASPMPHLTEKGRDWLNTLEDARSHDQVEIIDACADLVLSTNGLFR